MLAQMMEFATNDGKGTSDECQLMSVGIDSGAAEIAIPYTLVTEYNISGYCKIKIGCLLYQRHRRANSDFGRAKTAIGHDGRVIACNDFPSDACCQAARICCENVWSRAHNFI